MCSILVKSLLIKEEQIPKNIKSILDQHTDESPIIQKQKLGGPWLF